MNLQNDFDTSHLETPKKCSKLLIYNVVHLICYAILLPALLLLIGFLLISESAAAVDGNWDILAFFFGSLLLGIVIFLIFMVVLFLCSVIGTVLSAILLKAVTGKQRSLATVTLVINAIICLFSFTMLLILSVALILG